MLGERGALRDIWGYYGSVVWGVGGVLWECFGGVEYFWVGVC